jgi:hypothetical protein
MIPFETRFTLLGLSNLQWMFALAAASSIPFLVRRRYELFTGVVIAAAVFAATQWIAAAAAPDFFSNAAKAALRVTAGVILMAAAAVSRNKDEMLRVWVVGALAAAVYALAAHAGFGVPALFRTEEFYRGAVQRLSGSFDYPNTAAAFFAMTIPLVWMVFRNPAARYASAGLLWLALLLTQSRGGGAALGAAAALAVIGPYSRRAGAGRLKMIRSRSGTPAGGTGRRKDVEKSPWPIDGLMSAGTPLSLTIPSGRILRKPSALAIASR